MKIGQVIEQMLQCEDKKFKGELGGHKYLISTVNGRLEIMRSSKEGTVVSHELPFTWILRDIDWEVARPPVSFMEVCNSGKNFKVKHSRVGGNWKGILNLDSLMWYLSRCESDKVRDILTNGQFFIID